MTSSVFGAFGETSSSFNSVLSEVKMDGAEWKSTQRRAVCADNYTFPGSFCYSNLLLE